jgi:hypothetical protein
MSTKKSETSPGTATPKPPRSASKAPYRQHSGREKTEAVLALWSERRKPAELCRELEITWQQLLNWQQRALSVMMQALEPRVRQEEQRPPALGSRLRKLLEQQARVKPAARAARRILEPARTEPTRGEPEPKSSGS